MTSSEKPKTQTHEKEKSLDLRSEHIPSLILNFNYLNHRNMWFMIGMHLLREKSSKMTFLDPERENLCTVFRITDGNVQAWSVVACYLKSCVLSLRKPEISSL